MTSNMLRKSKFKRGSRHDDKVNDLSEAELPVDGDATLVITNDTSIDIIEEMRIKPIWWYICGFPLWCKIAKVGKENMTMRMKLEGDVIYDSPDDVNEVDIFLPNGRDFFIAIFFIVFGVVAQVAGLGSIFVDQVTSTTIYTYYE